MTVVTHHFSIGELQLMVVADALKNLDEDRIQSMLPAVTAADLAIFQSQTYSRQFSYNTVYLRHGDTQVLIDTGSGEKGKPDEGHLLDTLLSAGITAAHIDKIIITHFHGDHYAGLLAPDHTAVFPKAEILVPRAEWDYWVESGQAPADRMALIQAAFAPYHGRIHFFEDGAELLPGVTAIALPGHSAGHTGLRIESGQDRLVHLADTLHLTLQLARPDLSPKFDYQPEIAAKTRWSILGQVADNHSLTLTFHLPFPGLGYIHRDNSGFRWDTAI